MKPLARSRTADETALAAAVATWHGDRPGILRLLECRLLHRGNWQYLGTRTDQAVAPWPVDSYRCDRCDRTWERPS